MFWLERPPYLRWIATVLLVGIAVAIDVRGTPTVAYPFAAADLHAGTRLVEDDIEWRRVQRGLLPDFAVDRMFVKRTVAVGEPIVASALTAIPPVSDGWWSVEMPLPDGAEPGTSARVVVADPPLATDAVIVSVAEAGAFDNSTTGLVAVPAEHADGVAAAAARGAAVLLLAPG